MKKLLFFITVVMLLVLVGCNNDKNGSTNTDSNANVESGSKEANDKEKESESEYYFKDNELVTEDAKIKITDTKVIQPGEKGNEYSDKPVFAIWYEITNLSEDEMDPSTEWIFTFEAIQDNNPNAVNELDMAGLPDERFLESQNESIKPNGTVENAVAYELDDLETPVTLVANDFITDEKLGEQTFEIK
ncbi:DUF5067 domain-containing protein [Caldibacillus lycopersici]|uniref:DUF5067 domain-containing protein n=1 Tax=Perspicuibacillus lycopersici TaxID=1325689 RepID=A0AAE3LRP7_9BACI|nr:DUF5067 domain-containing protein [Perspicuibacillus lycopersici]MCU9611968.1 DUF5067 domain-containing protein [Perspicuibacillus lycopersici]